MSKLDPVYNRVIIGAVLKWFNDAGYKQSLFVINADDCELPDVFLPCIDNFGHITFNFNSDACRNLELNVDDIEFYTLKNSVEYFMRIPYHAILGYVTDYGMQLFTPVPYVNDEKPEVKETFTYKQPMLKLELGDDNKAELRKDTLNQLSKINSQRKEKEIKPMVDTKSAGYPFPEDRFAEYNKRQAEKGVDTTESTGIIFTGTPGGITFYSRKKKPRVRPEWLTVIDGSIK